MVSLPAGSRFVTAVFRPTHLLSQCFVVVGQRFDDRKVLVLSGMSVDIGTTWKLAANTVSESQPGLLLHVRYGEMLS
eukprot:2457422-Amphidinium_carterae.1